jgi:hypothetical protein
MGARQMASIGRLCALARTVYDRRTSPLTALNPPSRWEAAMPVKNRRKTARKRAALKKKQKKRRARAAG